MHGQILANLQLMKAFQLASIIASNYAFKAEPLPLATTAHPFPTHHPK